MPSPNKTAPKAIITKSAGIMAPQVEFTSPANTKVIPTINSVIPANISELKLNINLQFIRHYKNY
ncbi:MAG: hypothetical protein ABJB76_00730 [Candidatus Nitrosocosmicus sp.]